MSRPGSSRVWVELANRVSRERERETCFEMRLERQPSSQLRESLNVCWERWREREGEKEGARDGKEEIKVKRSQVD